MSIKIRCGTADNTNTGSHEGAPAVEEGRTMALPNDPQTHTRTAPVRSIALQAKDLCLVCFGAGSYLDAIDGGYRYEYLPVICDRCGGSGHRHG
jgi:hypothetical protein